jgi:hypothetical protein|tara:strand:+ start:861 stop:1109 length:249 start_codon:yes stop_codon:yes gene_type:complete
MKEKFSITRVVTRDVITDFFQIIRNLFGMRLKGYEEIISTNIKELIKGGEKKYKIDWWRLSINPLTHSSIMITFYGEGTKKK